MTEVHQLERHEDYMVRRLKEEHDAVTSEKTPDQWDDVIAEIKSRIKKLEEDMAYANKEK